jgi:hypothetical protein
MFILNPFSSLEIYRIVILNPFDFLRAGSGEESLNIFRCFTEFIPSLGSGQALSAAKGSA